MAIIKVGTAADNLVALPDPSEMAVLLQDIDASTTTRSADGTLLRDRVAGGATAKRKIELKFPPMRTDAMKAVLQAIAPEFFWVEYIDPYEGMERVAQFYAGDRKAPLYNANLRGNGPLWENLSFNIIEK